MDTQPQLAEAGEPVRTWRAGLLPPTSLIVVFDDRCGLCQRCCQWLASQAQLVPIEFAAASNPLVIEWLGADVPVGDELVVVGDNGHLWVGPDAFVTCLWALRDRRTLARALQKPGLRVMAKHVFHGISSGRSVISSVVGPPAGDPNCADGSCSVPT